MEMTNEEWENTYSPLLNADGSDRTFETYGEYLQELKTVTEELAKKHGTKPYQHVWSRLDGEGNSLYLVNGWHLVNRLDYLVTSKPWGTGEESDTDIYIEVNY